MENREFYASVKAKYDEKYSSCLRMLTVLSFSRLIIFVAGIAGSILLFRLNDIAGIAFAVVSVFLFAVVIKRYSAREWERDYYRNLADINEDERVSLDGDYSRFNEGVQYIDPSHDFSHDTDIFGPGSLFQYLNRTFSDSGSDMLAGWLSNPFFISDTFMERAAAVKELSPMVDWRQKFIALGRMDRAGKKDRERLDDWLSGEPAFRNESSTRIISIVLPALTLISLLLSIMRVLPYSVFISLVLVNLGVLSLYLKRINRIHGMVSRQYSSLLTIKSLIEHIAVEKFESACLRDIHRNMTESRVKAISTINELAGIIKGFDIRLNMIMGVILNGILMWDIQSVLRLERWKRSVKVFIPGWFDDLARVDALVSLANYAFNNQEFIYPDESESGFCIKSEGMGHPLIKRNVRVVNDFSIDHAGEIVIITGANMAGKSTFLRTVAVNLVLAMAGAPVCAKRFTFTPSAIFSSMRTSDSLSENESYFYAELKRLKRLKERIEKGEKLFFILDEILKGTNSKDKSEGSRLFIEKIISYNATGIIATHDTSLGDLEQGHPGTVRNLCFEISIDGDTVSFDYLLHPGITTRMNAAILMRQQGIID